MFMGFFPVFLTTLVSIVELVVIFLGSLCLFATLRTFFNGDRCNFWGMSMNIWYVYGIFSGIFDKLGIYSGTSRDFWSFREILRYFVKTVRVFSGLLTSVISLGIYRPV